MIDNSVNITGEGKGGGLTNFQAAAAGTALNENQYERSRMKLTGAGRAQAAIGQATENVPADERVRGLDTITDQMGNYYRNLGKRSMVNLFGDIFSPNFQVPSWNPPAKPEKIEVNSESKD